MVCVRDLWGIRRMVACLFSSRRRHTRWTGDWSSDVCSSDLIGLLTPTGGGVELDSDWFDDPGTRMAGVLADDDRREALVRFADAVLAQGAQAQQDGVDLIPLFNLRNLAGDNSLPDLTVQVSLDARANKYVEVGLAATLSTTGPATRTEVRVPLYRAA